MVVPVVNVFVVRYTTVAFCADADVHVYAPSIILAMAPLFPVILSPA